MNPLITEQKTIPLSLIGSTAPTIRTLREACGWSYFELAARARVRPRVAYWMEQGIAVTPTEAAQVLLVLSRHLNRVYTLAMVQGVRLKERRSR